MDRLFLSDIKVQIKIALTEPAINQAVQRAADKAGLSIVAPPVDFSIVGSYENKSVDINRFNVYVERSIALPDGIEPSQITTGVVIDSNGNVRHVPTKVVQINGIYCAVINSLTNSTYAVVWNPLEFSDVSHHWAKEAVNDMGARMIVKGTGHELFTPDKEITRAEFASIIVRALGLNEENDSSNFGDVGSSAWYAGAVQTAYDYKLINGLGDGLFHPTEKITREQALVIITKAMQLTDLKVDWSQQDSEEILNSYTDAKKVSSWAKDATAIVLLTGILNGKSDQILAPKDFITRAEIAALMQRLLQKSDLI
ncbi:S-layer homology domain-containing protein [Paenibacillus sp. J45TS6]|uniref:S-layer homology domain-containing protein n=1 Tax=Paenibacillus sp. J45TS6 TaxID=2807196 RepID=UPI001BD03DD8|nr:S-layer homology domain-containing protein [Paenibacillus sp. J45TS6]